MSTSTSNIGLTKAATTEAYDVGVVNTNLDTVDAHDHGSAKGVAVLRLQTSATPTASGQVKVTTKKFQFYDGAALRTLGTIPCCHAQIASDQAITTGTAGVLATFAAEAYDTDTMHDTSVNPGRLTINTAGVYMLTACIGLAANATGYRAIEFRLNGGGGYMAKTQLIPGAATIVSLSLTIPYSLAAADYVELYITQNSGGDLNAFSAGSSFTATLVSLI